MEVSVAITLALIYWMLSRIDDQAKRAADALERIADALEKPEGDEACRPIDCMEPRE